MKTSIKMAEGIIPALFTLFGKNRELNLKPLPKYLAYLFNAGCDGVFVGGSNGECFLQSVTERKNFAEAVLSETGGKKPVILHIGSINPADAFDLAKAARSMNIHAVSSVAPFYYNYTIKETAEYYKKLILASEKPMIVYYIPENTGVRISSDEFTEKIINLPGVAGIKYTHTDLFQMQTLAEGGRNGRPHVYGGCDQMGICFLAMGADGLIGATFNLIPEVYTAMRASFSSGNIKRAMSLQKIANKFSARIRRHSKASYKALLALRGIDIGQPRACWEDLSKADITELKKTLGDTLNEFEAAP
jgi:N-acetylneuraminate lyase